MAKRNSKGRFVKSGGKTKGRKRSSSTRRKRRGSTRRGTLGGALAIIKL